MGIEIDRTTFAPDDYRSFRDRLAQNLSALERLLGDPQFGQGPGSIGAELEMYIVDGQGLPLHANQELLAEAEDPLLTLELNRYNLEYNLTPVGLDATPFVATESEILARLAHLGEVAARRGGRIVAIGILPTLRPSDFGSGCITDRLRYHALVGQLIERRGSEFRIDIHGDDPLALEMADITLEGANTSFQVHYRVQPQAFADTFNAIQLATPLAVALGANSPSLFGHSLWHETRVPLFKQSIDTRQLDRYAWREPARVSFGQGWARRGAGELFAEVAHIYPPLLPLSSPQSPEEELGAGRRRPTLAELRLHQGTVWLWNRPIYDDHDGGHLRIEMRALPAGPTAVDMVANAAFLIGLAEGLRPDIDRLLPALPFAMAEHNFYRAAQHGLGAQLVWPRPDRSGYSDEPVSSIIGEMLPCARRGLSAIGIGTTEIDRYLGVIENRLLRGRTGALWQREKLALLREQLPADEALHQLLEEYINNSAANLPIAEWNL